MPSRPRAVLVFNPVAGRGGDEPAGLCAMLEPHFVLEVASTSPETGADACARVALSHRPDLVIAAGGDGTVSLVASALAGSKVPLAVVPRGTSNSIASALGIPTDDSVAVEALLHGEVHALDVARANGRTMVLHASAGFHAVTVTSTARSAKNRFGVLAYVLEGLVNLADLTEFDLDLETEAARVRCRAVNVTIANLAPRKALLARGSGDVSAEDGLLDITIVAGARLTEAVGTGLHMLRRALRGEASLRDNIGYLSTPRVRIRTTPPQPLLVDGEAAGEGNLEVECIPRGLHVVLPAHGEEPPSEHARGPERKLTGLPDLDIEPKEPRT